LARTRGHEGGGSVLLALNGDVSVGQRALRCPAIEFHVWRKLHPWGDGVARTR
jgi:hypothetical protein